MTLLVERATEDDLADVIAVEAAHRNGVASIAYLERVIRDRQCYIARQGWDAVGYAVLTQNFFHYYFIELLIVHPEHRRKGVASEIIRYLEKILPDYKLFTSTNETNTEAQALFEKLGFVKSGWIKNLDDNDPEIIYVRMPASRRIANED